MSWYNVYLNEIKQKKNAKNYIEDKIKHKQVFIKLLKKYSKNNKKLIEAGCGTGIISSYMASKEYDVLGIDIDEEILQLSTNLAKEYFDEDKKLKFEKMSILDMQFSKEEFDVCFSNGVLEHFEDEDIICSLKNQMNISRYVVLGIPTQFFDKTEALYGDERFLPLEYWRYLITKSGGRILEEKSFHYMNILEKICNIKKIFREKPFRVFVIEKI